MEPRERQRRCAPRRSRRRCSEWAAAAAAGGRDEERGASPSRMHRRREDGGGRTEEGGRRRATFGQSHTTQPSWVDHLVPPSFAPSSHPSTIRPCPIYLHYVPVAWQREGGREAMHTHTHHSRRLLTHARPPLPRPQPHPTLLCRLQGAPTLVLPEMRLISSNALGPPCFSIEINAGLINASASDELTQSQFTIHNSGLGSG